jgi:hypothetical protein
MSLVTQVLLVNGLQQPVKLVEENIDINTLEFGLGNDLLYMTPKSNSREEISSNFITRSNENVAKNKSV